MSITFNTVTALESIETFAAYAKCSRTIADLHQGLRLPHGGKKPPAQKSPITLPYVRIQHKELS